MSRTGIEDKLPWQQVPQAVRRHVAQALGAPVARATRIWGGYAPTPTYRLVLKDGRRAFFKGTNQDSNVFMKKALLSEERVYRDVAPILGKWMPQLYAVFRVDDWHVLILEDLGSQSVPPWTPKLTRAITHALAAFHHSSLGVQPPTWLPLPDGDLAAESWTLVLQESLEFQRIAALAGEEASQVVKWFQQVSPTIEQVMQQSILKEGADVILHGDLRSDNLRFRQGRLCLFDWPSITLGRPEWDMVAFAQTVTVEGGPSPEQVMTWYGEQFSVSPDAIECALAWWLAFFARRAWLPEVPSLPRLRRFQRQQLGILISWTARHWLFPEPAWVAHLLK